MNIYTEENLSNSRNIDISLEDGKLRMDLQDLGPAAGDDNEYERCATDISAILLKQALEVQSDGELLEKIAKEFGTAHGFDRFTSFCRENWISFSYWAG